MRTTRLKTAVRRWYVRFVKLEESPQKIALGMSLGILVGMTPFFGAHLATCIVLASIFGWNKIAAVIGANITNVATIPLIYPFNYWVGGKLVGASRGIVWPATFRISEMLVLIKKSPLVMVDLMVGGMVTGIPLAVIAYFAVFRAIQFYRQRKHSPFSDHCI